jgi:hypothetical protein
MNRILNFARPSRFLKPERSLLLLMLLVFCTAAFATPTTPTSDFIDNGDGTVTHKLTGLVWMRCAMGQTWDKATASCTGTAATYTWDAAMALKSDFAGKTDWRLPNIAELLTIVEHENYSPAINTTLFPNTPGGGFWSSSTLADDGNAAWFMRIFVGDGGNAFKSSNWAVRLVREWSLIYSLNLDMTNPICRYVAPIYSTTWRLMKVKQTPSCRAVLHYHTWRNFTFWENYTANIYYKNRLANIDTSNQLFNSRLELIDKSISVLNDVLDLDLKNAVSNGVLLPSGYKLSTDIMKSKGIVASLAAGQSPFNLSTTAGKILNKTLKDKIIIEGGSKVLCNLFLDSAAAESCSNAAVKVSGCVDWSDWKSKAICVKDGVFSYVTVINNAVDIFDVIKITKNLNGYTLINDYLEAYYAKGTVAVPNDEVKLESDIKAFAKKEAASSTLFGDYDMAFVKAGIRDGVYRTNLTALQNVKLVESVRNMLKPKTIVVTPTF